MNIKAIETVYNGYRFRSRLEARWAYFFDLLGVEYRYETEGYELSDGTRYLPDFWLPKQEEWVEIKGQNPSPDEAKKALRLCLDTGQSVHVCIDDPLDASILDCHPMTAIHDPAFKRWLFQLVLVGKDGGIYMGVDGEASETVTLINSMGVFQHPTLDISYSLSHQLWFCEDCNRLFFGLLGLYKSDNCPIDALLTPRLKEARSTARQARFEHGQTPTVNKG